MRGSYSGQYTRAPLSLHGFESRTSLHVNASVAQRAERATRTRVIGVQVVTEVSISRQALVAQWIERSHGKGEDAGSNPASGSR